MTIGKQEPVTIAYGNNVTTKFDYDFFIEIPEQLKIEHTDLNGNVTTLIQDVDYKVISYGDDNGGKYEFPIQGSTFDVLAWDESTNVKERLVASLDLELEQESEFDISGDLNKHNLEKTFDYQMRCMQIFDRKLRRCVKVQEGSNIDTDELTLNINTIVENIEQVQINAGHIDKIDTTAEHINNIDTTADHIRNVDTVATHINKVDITADHIGNVDIAANNINKIDTTAGAIDKIKTVANSINNVNTTASHIANVDTVAGHIGNVDSVAGDIVNIDKCANALPAINAAPTHAQTATTQAGIATEKANDTIIALSQAEELKNSLELFSSVDCGRLSDTRNIIYDAGTLDDMYVNYIDCGSAADKYISDNDITNMLNIPVLQKQADATDEALNAATKRIAKNENDIAALQNGLAGTNENLTAEIDKIDNNVAGAVGRIEANENNIATLQHGLLNTNIDLSDAEDRIEQNEKDILELQKISGVFSYVDCGSLSDVREVIYDAGTLNNAATDYIDCSNLEKFFLCLDDLRNVCTIPNLLNAVADLSAKLTDALGRIAELENGIDCGVLRYVR